MEYVSDRNPEIIKKGEWYTFCCMLDLEQATEDTPSGGTPYRIYQTREDAEADPANAV